MCYNLQVGCRCNVLQLTSRSSLKCVTTIFNNLKKQKLRYYGHITRKKGECLQKAVIKGYVSGERSRARPRRWWMKDVAYLTNMDIKKAARMADDREQWKDVLHAVNPPEGRRHYTTTILTKLNQSIHNRPMEDFSSDDVSPRATDAGEILADSTEIILRTRRRNHYRLYENLLQHLKRQIGYVCFWSPRRYVSLCGILWIQLYWFWFLNMNINLCQSDFTLVNLD